MDFFCFLGLGNIESAPGGCQKHYYWCKYFDQILSNFIKNTFKGSTLFTQLSFKFLIAPRSVSIILLSPCLLGLQGALSFQSEKAVPAAATTLWNYTVLHPWLNFLVVAFFQTLPFHLYSHLMHPVFVFFEVCEPS